MNEDKKLKYTTYFAGPIEHAKGNKVVDKAREKLWKYLGKCEDLGIYDPVEMEAQKVDRDSSEQVNYIRGLKQGGHWEIFFNEMWHIWFGDVDENTDIIGVLQNLRMRKHIDKNRKSDYKFWGDAEAVVRSDFIVVNLPDVQTVGTHWEIFLAALFRIPVYLILPDRPKTEANSTMIFGVEKLSKGKIFYSVKECTDYIKGKYNLQEKKGK